MFYFLTKHCAKWR